MTLAFAEHGFPPCWRAYFLLLRQKKVAKEKATPGSAPAAPVPCATRHWRGLRNSGLRPSDSPRPFSASGCVAQRLSGGPKGVRAQAVARNATVEPKKCPKLKFPSSATDGLPGPLRGAEQRRKAGGFRRGLSEGRSPEFRSRPAFRVAQGTGAAGADPGVAFSLLTFLLAKQKKVSRASSAENTSPEKAPHITPKPLPRQKTTSRQPPRPPVNYTLCRGALRPFDYIGARLGNDQRRSQTPAGLWRRLFLRRPRCIPFCRGDHDSSRPYRRNFRPS